MSRLASVGAVALVLGTLLAAPAAGRAQEKQEKEGAKPAASQWTTPPAVKHSLEGRSNCIMCHSGAMKQVPAMPANHKGRTVKECLLCHAPDAEVQKTAPPAIPHDTEGRSNCLMCHKPGAMKNVPDAPASHAGRTIEMCPVCHTPAKAEKEKE
jgi:hypothetical protein